MLIKLMLYRLRIVKLKKITLRVSGMRQNLTKKCIIRTCKYQKYYKKHWIGLSKIEMEMKILKMVEAMALWIQNHVKLLVIY